MHEGCLCHALGTSRTFERQARIPVIGKGQFNEGFRTDIVVDGQCDR
jgi:hypothetical protein